MTRLLVILALALFLAPALAGCVASEDRDDRRTQKGVRSLCPGAAVPLQSVEVPSAFERRSPSASVVPPIQGQVRIVLLVPSAEDAETLPAARMAVDELKAAGAPVQLDVVPVAETGSAAGLAAFRAVLVPSAPSAVVSALDDATTDGMVEESYRRRVPLFATAATAQRLTTLHEIPAAPPFYFFRVPPAASVEGRALAEVVWAAGCRSANLVVGASERDQDVRVAFRDAFERKGGSIGAVVNAANASEAVAKTEYMAKAGVDEPRPEALVVLANPERSAAILREAYETKVSARTVLFFGEGARDPSFVASAGRDDNGHVLAENLRGTAAMRADTRATEPFLRAFPLAAGGREATNLSLRAYDAVYLTTLAAYCARQATPEEVARAVPIVQNRDTGDTAVSGADAELALGVAATCRADYVGAAHDYDVASRGEPASGRFLVWTVTSDGALRPTTARYEPPSLPPAR